jgi:hypothetical protein
MSKASPMNDLEPIDAQRKGRARVLKLLACMGITLACMPSHAAYNANLTGFVTQILTYPSGVILFALNNQPTSNGSCNPQFFELDAPVPPPPPAVPNPGADAILNRMYARLLQAYTLGQAVNVGYDDAGNCAPAGNITVYRIG